MKELIIEAVGELAAIPYFPRDEGARVAIMKQLGRFVDRPERLRWLVDAALNTMRRWDGVAELRGLYCTRFKPVDGVEQTCSLPGYSPADCEADHYLEHEKYKALEKVPIDLRKRI